MQIGLGDMEIKSMEDNDFRLFRELIHQKTGIWLREGKQVMLASRLSRRLRHHAMHSFADYYTYLEKTRDGGTEISELINCVTTNKTSFFREAHHFEFLAGRLVPELQAAARSGSPKEIRIWSAACSTGEEPYSIVISLIDALAMQHASWKLNVVASDIDTMVLRTAVHGIYDSNAIDVLDPALRARYFLRGTGDQVGQVKIKPEVASCVRFEQINLMETSWRLEGGFDAIFFRNALIYFKPETQELFLRKMLRFLKPKGYLFLGHSEHVPWLHDIVVPLPKTVYQLRA